jgi:hypothetical protein
VGGLLTLAVVSSFSQGLPDVRQQVLVWSLTAFGAAIGFLVGSTVVARAMRNQERLVLFSGLTAGVGGGMVGCSLAVSLLGMYLYTYAEWPSDLLDQVLMLLAFPAFGSVGFFVGAGIWAMCGLVAGAVISRLAPRPR